MAIINREVPRCSICGSRIARAIFKNESMLPGCMKTLGDTFIRWEYIDHDCDDEKDES